MKIAKHVRKLEGYVPGEQPRSRSVVKLNTNENPYQPSPACGDVLRRFSLDRLRRYPDPVFTDLRGAIAELNGARPECVFVGNGSDEILSVAARAFVEDDESIGSLDPSYSLYKTLAAIRNVKWVGVAGGAVLSVAVIVGLILWAGDEPGYGPRVRCEDRGRILVGGAHPARWVVDDLQMLGHVMTGRDMRDWYVKHPGAPAVGYLNSVWRIPTDGRVHRLTLAGEAGKDYLKWLKKKGYPEKMPQSVVFLSPPFPPSEIPEELRRRADVSVVIGEFAARYSREYLTPRPDVTIVRNVEIYLPNWMNFVVGPTG